MKDNIKSKTVKALSWSAIERFSVQGIQFLVDVILARLLFPKDFGLIGMLTIFIALSQVFVDSGFSKALIQKRDRTENDLSTVFFFNISISILLYVVLYLFAPYIANFYDMPQLSLLTRYFALTIIINSFTVIPIFLLTVDLNFKVIAKVRFLAAIISGAIAIYCAYSGMGVWSIIVLNIVKASFIALGLFIAVKYLPKFQFSYSSFKGLFKFASKLLSAGFVGTVFQYMYYIVIGKFFSAANLGYYTKADQFSALTAGTITSIIHNVSFPVLASLQHDRIELVKVYRKFIVTTALIIFPIMILLSVLAHPLVMILLTDKWLFVVPLLQWLSLARIFTPISALNMNILNAIGRSDLYLKIDLIKIPISILILVITIFISVKAVVIGCFVGSLISFFLNSYYPSKIFDYGWRKQIIDLKEIIYSSFMLFVVSYLVKLFIDSDLLKLLLSVLLGGIVYYGTLLLLKVQVITNMNRYLFDKFLKKRIS